MATNEPLTGARIPTQSDGPLGGLQVANSINDAAPATIPYFATASDRDTKFAAWVANGHTMRNGLHCHVQGTGDMVYLSSTWVPIVPGALTTYSPSSYGGAFTANGVDPIKAYRDQNAMTDLTGLITTSVTIVADLAGTWFTLPVGARPTSKKFGVAFIEAGALATYEIRTDGTVVGIALIMGSYPIPAGKYMQLCNSYKAA